jgi:hypothetical protein
MSLNLRCAGIFFALWVTGCDSSSSGSRDMTFVFDLAVPLDLTPVDLIATDAPAGACTNLGLTSGPVSETHLNTSIPTGNGGTFLDGLYVLTDIVVYDPASAGTSVVRQMLRKTGNVLEEVGRVDTLQVYSTRATVTFMNKQMMRVYSCPTGTDAGLGSATVGYTADATSLKLYDATTNKEYDYAKQ